MKIIVSLVPLSEVVDDLLKAMAESQKRFSQERSFDFCLVRVDQFEVPPKYEEAFDDAYFSYRSRHREHPLVEDMRPILERPYTAQSGVGDVDHLEYAAVVYRRGDFKNDAYWGARLYRRDFRSSMKEPPLFMRLDCRENGIAPRGEAPSSADRFVELPTPTDRFCLAWVLAWAAKEITLENGIPDKAGYVPSEIMEEFRVFKSGLGEIDTLAKKSAFWYEQVVRVMRYSWACVSMDHARPSPYKGAGKHLQMLFESMRAPKSDG
ncbi:MAG: hypothetical protein WCV84_05065 [Patescibacteria group bacterium]